MSSVLRYIPKAHRKEGKSPFNRCASGNARGKTINEDNGASMITLKKVSHY